MSRLASCLVLACLASCEAAPAEDTGGTDAAVVPHDGILYDGVLELGEGEDTFRPIASGDVLLLARGCQGSQHVWLALRSRDLDPRGMTVRLDLVDAATDERVSLEFFVRLSFDPDTGADYAELTAITLQVPFPDDALERDLVLRGEIFDRAGHGARAEVPVRVAWGPEVCGG